MIRLIKENVEKIVDTVDKAEKLKAKGFTIVEEKATKRAKKSESGD